MGATVSVLEDVQALNGGQQLECCTDVDLATFELGVGVIK